MSEDTSENRKHLSSRLLRSGSWVAIGNITGQLLRLLSNLIMTRLLVPEMFGVMALAQVFNYVVVLISDIGLSQSIIQSKRGEDPVFLNTAWTLQALKGCITCVIVSIIGLVVFWAGQAGLISEHSAFSEPILPLIIVVMSLPLFISGFTSTNVVLANRKLSLGRLTVLDLSTQLLGLVIMIVWAYFYRNIWALVAGVLISNVVRTVLTHVVFPNGFKNRFAWDKTAIKEIVHFGKWLFISSFFTAFYMQGDRLLLGGFETAEVVGIYIVAFLLMSSVRDFFTKFCDQIYFPALSEVYREDRPKTIETYYSIRKNTDAIAIFMAGVLFVSGQAIVEFLYSSPYFDAGWMLQIMALNLLFVSPLISRVLLLAIGISRYSAELRVLQTILLIIFFPILYSMFGIRGAIWSLVVVSFFSVVFDYVYRARNGLLILWKEFRMYPVFILGWCAGFVGEKLIRMLPFGI